VDVEREPGAELVTIEVDIAAGETDTKLIAERLGKVLKKW
jgi:hypothetical protein